MRLEWNLDTRQPPEWEQIRALLEQAARAAVEIEGLPEPGRYQACVGLTSDDAIRELNRRTRSVDAATDVLSFPQASFPRGTAREYPSRLRALVDPDTGLRHLGDIIISVERAQAQAAEYGHSLRRELAYLLVHGVCHLMGYDHMNEADKTRMRALEEAALARVAMVRGGQSSEGGTSTMTEQDLQLLEAARTAMGKAYIPYSHYAVGACLLAEDGRMFTGCNVENASFGATICAERTALVKAVSEGARKFSAIAIAAESSAPYPCGMCRQALNEFAPGIRVLVTWGDELRETTLDALLPHSFGPESLEGTV